MSSRQSNASASLIRYFMHPSLLQESDLRHRARILVVTLLVLSAMIAVMDVAVAFSPLPPGPRLAAVSLCTAALAGSIVALFALRRGGNFRLCSMLVVAADFIAITGGVVISGGSVASPVTQLLAMPPMLAFFFGGIRWGTVTALAALTEIIVFLLLSRAGVEFSLTSDMRWSRENPVVASVIGLIFLSAMAFVYDYTAEMLKRERDNEQFNVSQLARTDALTGLSNRLSFDAELQARLAACAGAAQAGYFALCYIDLDGFKPINDQHGHDVGDEVLRVISERLRHMTRDNDRIGRHGGDEFMLILDAMQDSQTLRMLAARLVAGIAEPIVTSVGTLRVSGSLGFAVCPDHGADAQTLMQAADSAMYTAKRAGRGWHLYQPDGTKGGA